MSAPTPEFIAEFVRESNAIEGIYAPTDHTDYDDYRDAAQLVVDAGKFIQVIGPRAIHAVIMREHPEAYPGDYRQVRVWVDGREKPQPHLVAGLMFRHIQRVTHLVNPRPFDLWEAHYEFESIHPFVDGNGRTGRLWLNVLRQFYGYDWTIVHEADKEAYYQAIRSWEQTHVIG